MKDIPGPVGFAANPAFTNTLIFLLACAVMAWNLSVSHRVFGQEPLRDSEALVQAAAGRALPAAAGLPEPLAAAAVRLAAAAGQPPDGAVRTAGLAAYAAVFVLTAVLLSLRAGPTAGGLAAFFLASNPYMGYYAMQGSTHLLALVFLIPFWFFLSASAGGYLRALAAGLFAGLACLSRLDAAWAVLLLAVFVLASGPGLQRAKEALLSLGLALLLALPYLGWQRSVSGNAMQAQELALRRWSNVDRFGYAGRAGWQSGPLGTGAFLIREGPARALTGAFSGLGRAAGRELPRALHHKYLIVFVFLGAYAALVLGQERLLFFLGAALLPVLPLAAIRQVPASGGIELKYYLWTLWALFALAGFGLQEIVKWTERSFKEWAYEKARSLLARGKGRSE